MILAFEKTVGSASALKPVITQVCAPRQASRIAGELVFMIALAAPRRAPWRVW